MRLLKIIVVGAGKTGNTLVNILSSEKHDVTIIEKKEDLSKEIANKTDTLVIKGDATDMNILKEAGIEKADALIAVTEDDKTNLMICEIAKSTKVKKIIARVNNPENESLFTKLGIDSIIPVVGLTVTKIKRELEEDTGQIIAELGNGDVEVIAATIEKGSKLIGKNPGIKNAVIGTIYRNGELIIPTKKTKLKEGDVLVITVKSKKSKSVLRRISGK